MKFDTEKVRQYLKVNIKTVISVVVLVVSILIIIFFGKITFSSNEEEFTVDAWLSEKTTISYENVRELLISEKLDVGIRKSGMETGRVFVGTFENNDYGSYKLYAYKSVNVYITVLSDKEVLVFNCGTEEETREIYYQILRNSSHLKK